MDKEFEDNYKKLKDQPIGRNEIFNLTSGLKEIADAISANSAWDGLRHTRNAIRHLDEFRGNIIPTPDLTEEEANLASGLHTYMRKCMDDDLGTILYRLISESRGTNIWYAFIKGAIEGNKNPKMISYRNGIEEADETFSLSNDTTDDLFMLSALKMWTRENFQDALDWVEGTE